MRLHNIFLMLLSLISVCSLANENTNSTTNRLNIESRHNDQVLESWLVITDHWATIETIEVSFNETGSEALESDDRSEYLFDNGEDIGPTSSDDEVIDPDGEPRILTLLERVTEILAPYKK